MGAGPAYWPVLSHCPLGHMLTGPLGRPPPFGFILSFFFLAISHGTQDLSSPTRNLNPHPYIGSMESKLLDHQGNPRVFFFPLSALDSVSLFLFPSVSAFDSHSMSGCLSLSLTFSLPREYLVTCVQVTSRNIHCTWVSPPPQHRVTRDHHKQPQEHSSQGSPSFPLSH